MLCELLAQISIFYGSRYCKRNKKYLITGSVCATTRGAQSSNYAFLISIYYLFDLIRTLLLIVFKCSKETVVYVLVMIKFCVLKVLKNRHLQWHLTATGLVTLVLNFLVFPVILKNVVHSPHYHASLSGKEEWRYLMNRTKFCHEKALAYWMNQSQNLHDLPKGFPSWHRGPDRYPGAVQ